MRLEVNTSIRLKIFDPVVTTSCSLSFELIMIGVTWACVITAAGCPSNEAHMLKYKRRFRQIFTCDLTISDHDPTVKKLLAHSMISTTTISPDTLQLNNAWLVS